MILKRRQNLVHAVFSNLSVHPELVHGVFLMQWDTSRNAYTRLNIGGNSRQANGPDNVRTNLELISRCMDKSPTVLLKQVHGRSVCVLDSTKAVSDALAAPPEADAAVTTRKDVGLAIQAADCQPVMLFDPVQKAVANIHSGWRGSVANIIGACIEAMQDRFGTRPADLVAGIGPSLGPCCAEFVHYRNEIPEIFWRHKDDRHRFNFWQISHDQLTAAGVPASNIEWSGICTKCNPHLFFSYRHARETGRFAAVISLKLQTHGNAHD